MAANINGTSPLRFAGAPVSAVPLAMVAWARRPTNAVVGSVSSVGVNGVNTSRHALRVGATGGVEAFTQASSGSTNAFASAAGFPAAAWALIGGQWLAAADRRSRVGSATASNTTSITVGTPSDFRVGGTHLDAALWEGELAEVAVWDLTAWGGTAAERAAAWDAAFADMRDTLKAPSHYPTGLAGYWPLIADGLDASGNGRHLTGAPSSWSAHPPGIVYPAAGGGIVPLLIHHLRSQGMA